MKKYVSTAAFLLVSCIMFAQEVVKDSDYYLSKSKRQNKGAKVMLIGGGALVGVGFLIGDRKESSFDDAATGGIIALVGAISMIGSIPVFMASARNKRKAASLSLKTMPVPTIKNSGLASKPVAAVSITFSL